MVEMVTKYWMEYLLGIVASGLGIAVKMLYSRFKVFNKKQTALEEGISALLQDRLQEKCRNYLDVKKCCPLDERDTLERIYKSLEALGSTQTDKDLYNRCLKLPYRREKE